MRQYTLLVLCACALTACEESGQSSTLTVGVTLGTRLSPKFLLADDGTLFLHPTIWNDFDYGECVFRTAADGKNRCLPNVATQLQQMFFDPGCTQPAFFEQPNTCMPSTATVVVRTKEPTGCDVDGAWSVFPTKERIQKGILFQVDAATGGVCLPVFNIDSPDDGQIVVLDAEIPPFEFVSAWR